MNYLRGSLSAAYQYYRDLPPINASTLTGAIDVIVIQRKDENGLLELACTPFHVRFGKWQILRPGEKKVNVQVNGHPIPFNMKIGEAGEAFFVFETEEDVPEDLMTSPILQASQPAASNSGATSAGGRFGAKDNHDDDKEANDAVGVNEEQEIKDAAEDAIPEPDFLDLDATETTKESDHNIQAADITQSSKSLPLQPTISLNDDDDATRKPSLLGKTANRASELGKRVVHESKRVAELQAEANTAEHVITKKLRRASSVDDSASAAAQHGDPVPAKEDRKDPNPPVAYLDDVVVDMAGYHSKERSDRTVKGREGLVERIMFDGDMPPSVAENAQALLISQSQKRKGSLGDATDMTEDLTPTSSRAQSPTLSPTTPATSVNVPVIRATSEPPELDLNQLNERSSSMNNSPPRYSWEWGSFPVQTPSKSTFSNHERPSGERRKSELERATTLPLSGDRDRDRDSSPDTLDGERNGEEIDEEEDAMIHFGRGGKLSSVGEYGYMLEFKGRTTKFELSLCGDVNEKSHEEAQAEFKQEKVSFRQFIENPALVHRDELCILWKGRYISRKQSSPLLAALVVWRQATLGSVIVQSDEEPLSSSDERETERLHPTKSISTPPQNQTQTQGRWSRWFGRSRSGRETPASSASTPLDGPGTPKGLGPSGSTPSVASAPLARAPSPDVDGGTSVPGQQNGSTSTSGPSKHYVKTLRLTSDQLKELNLKKGPNSITFSISATGLVTCTARIFVWDAADQIVISDIDGTITKSDALGHVFTMIGRDWTHSGVAKLYTDICRNGYKIMYLTSRAIGQADSTRDYLRGINQNNYQLPEGPVIMSPDRLMASLHREVILRQPEVFKMACLRDIQRLFGPIHRNPFYAGFGNRITDALSYRSVNVPSGRIFTIDSSGEVKMELLELAGYKSSYIHMTDLVDQMFPPIHRKWAPEFTDANFWRQPIAEFDFPDFRPASPQPSGTPSPPSPALSARSDASMQTGLSRLRNFSLRGGRPQPEFIPAGTKTNGNDPGSKSHQRAKSSLGQERMPNVAGHTRHTSAGGVNGIAIPRGQRNDDPDKAMHRLSGGSMPGSYDGFRLDDEYEEEDEEEEDEEDEEDDEEYDDEDEHESDEGELDDHPDDYDDLLAPGAMDSIPYI